jgi:hypothetical protein
MILDRRRLAIFLMVLVTLIQGAYGGVQITASGGGNGGSGSVSMNYDTLKSTAVSSQIAINGATITPSTAIAGPIPKFEQTHAVKDRSGKSASVYVKVVKAPLGLTYSSTVLPKEGSLKTTEPWVSAEQSLTVPKADSIKCTATASASLGKLSASVGIEEMKSKSVGDYVTLTGYYGKAYASATEVEASQTATDGTADSIKVFAKASNKNGMSTLSEGLIKSGSLKGYANKAYSSNDYVRSNQDAGSAVGQSVSFNSNAGNKERYLTSASVDVDVGTIETLKQTATSSASLVEVTQTAKNANGDFAEIISQAKNSKVINKPFLTSANLYVNDGAIESFDQKGTVTASETKVTLAAENTYGSIAEISSHAENKAASIQQGLFGISYPSYGGSADFVVKKTNDEFNNINVDTSATSDYVNIQSDTGTKKALILDPFLNSFSAADFAGAGSTYFKKVGSPLIDKGYALTYYANAGVSLNHIQELDDYIISIFRTHGFQDGYALGFSNKKDIQANDGNDFITPDQFTFPNKNDMIILDGCSSFKSIDGMTQNPYWADTFKNAKVRGGFKEDAYPIVDTRFMSKFIERICAGDTADVANDAAYTYTSDYFIQNQLSKISLKKFGAAKTQKLILISNPSEYTVNPGDLIQAYIDKAFAGDTITISPGIFNENLVIDKSLNLKGAGSTESGTVVDGMGKGSVFTIGKVDPNIDVKLYDMLIRNGIGPSDYMIPNGIVNSIGSGILNRGTLTVDHCTIQNNGAYADGTYGGGIYSSGDLTVTDSTISDNLASYGGGIFLNNYENPLHALKAKITDSEISGNAVKTYAGGIFNFGGGDLTITGITISGNGGGGIVNNGNLEMVSGSISGNGAVYNGGGIYNYGIFTMKGGSISDNIVYYGGAGTWGNTVGCGIYNAQGGILNLEGGSISGNNAGNGGGIYNSQGGTLNLEGTSIISNTADNNGGGIFNAGSAIIKEGSSISLNIADTNAVGIGDGGGIFNTGTLAFLDQYGNPTTDQGVIDSIVNKNYLQSITGPLSDIAP